VKALVIDTGTASGWPWDAGAMFTPVVSHVHVLGRGDFGTVASLSFRFSQCAAGCWRFTRRLNLCCGMQNCNRLSQYSVSDEVYIQEKNLQRTRLWIGGWISLKKQVLSKSKNLLANQSVWYFLSYSFFQIQSIFFDDPVYVVSLPRPEPRPSLIPTRHITVCCSFVPFLHEAPRLPLLLPFSFISFLDFLLFYCKLFICTPAHRTVTYTEYYTICYINPLAPELDIYSLAHHLWTMWTFYETRRVT